MMRWFRCAALVGMACTFLGVRAEERSETWWSLRPLARPALPLVDRRYPDWAANPVDRFVLHKMLAKGLEPTAPADRRTLIRRVYFDLIGLPPTPEEIDAFVKAVSAAAYENIVDRLLASPRYGERWARHWMDICHFAETHGHDQDVPREHAWPYRDYLIHSFNSDKPYGRFVQEQIAGDVLFPDEPGVIPALGFLAAGPWDESSLRDIREDTLDRKAGQYLDRDDMIGTVSFALLSTTVQCARCHDHKFDPISQEEYYGLQAVFAGIDRANRAFDPDPQVHTRRLRLSKQKSELLKNPQSATQFLNDPALAAWEKSQASSKDVWTVLDPEVFASAGGATPTKLPDRSVRFAGKRPEKDTYTFEALAPLPAISAVRLEVLTDDSLPHHGPGRQDNGNLHLSEFKVEIVAANHRQALPIARAFADFNQVGWEIDKAIDGKPASAWGIYPEVGKTHAAVFVFKQPVKAVAGQRLLFTLEQQHGGSHLIGRPRLSATSGNPQSISQPLPSTLQIVLAKPEAQRSTAERLELTRHVMLAKVEAELAALPAPRLVYAAANDFKPEGSFAPAKACRPIHMLRRGDIKRPGAAATPGALACVPGLEASFKLAKPDDEGQRRAAFARWISSPRNPLTWRSIANRVWHYHFGRGIVSTPSDFGRMGALPSHPELLDWLAATLQEDGGSLKKLHRRIVTSATYRQASTHHARKAQGDADNVYLWRMNRSRLDAETLRDTVLQVSGQLDLTMGGPSVKHFVQSPGIHRTPKVDYLAFDPDGPGAQRRSIYRFVFRTVPDPFLDALDCPDASQFTAVRSSSLSALQALALLNDPFMVRMSEHFARRVASAGPIPAQVRLAYRLALGREATARESAALGGYAERHGMANACRLLFNCNEFMFVP